MFFSTVRIFSQRLVHYSCNMFNYFSLHPAIIILLLDEVFEDIHTICNQAQS